ncbi:fatty acyl-CoA reductase wat-like isoform X2 [Lasioglossum baleicum]|uniref:fatty acyl-CoA reductase wat-like isoform X2 n=1 Tax=Lasioglossum baleicum TaxID=434251 RepID=UPI003FCEE0B6
MTSNRSDTLTKNQSNSLVSEINGKSEIAEFYNGTKVLVTGGTGFLGKLLIEKLLRSCPGIKTIYMFVRPKKGKSVGERFKENFEEVIYERLKKEQPNFLSKIVMIEGDAAEDDFGMTPEVKATLMDTNIIFHAAANVRFNEKLRECVNTNVRTTKSLLLWAKQLSNLKAFIYVSTAFSNCLNKTIDEIHYPPPIDADKLITLIDCLDDDRLLAAEPSLLQNWPNTYIFTKAAAENVVLKYADDFPVGIVRPSIVTSTAEEPLTAWINNYYANIVAAAWDIWNRKVAAKLEQKPSILDEERVPVYNSVASPQNPLDWQTYMKYGIQYGLEICSVKQIWYYMIWTTRYISLYQIFVFFLHTIPAHIVDTIARLLGRKPMLVDTYRKIDKFSSVVHFFSTLEWDFRNENVRKMWSKLNSVDRKLFNFNVENLDWQFYLYNNIKGIRVYLVNDPINEESLKKGRAKYAKLQVAHYTAFTLYAMLLLWIAVSSVSFLWSICSLSQAIKAVVFVIIYSSSISVKARDTIAQYVTLKMFNTSS